MEDDEVESDGSFKIYLFMFIFFIIVISSPFVDNIISKVGNTVEGNNLTAWGATVQSGIFVFGTIVFTKIMHIGLI